MNILFNGWIDDKNCILINFLVVFVDYLVFWSTLISPTRLNSEMMQYIRGDSYWSGCKEVIQLVTNNVTKCSLEEEPCWGRTLPFFGTLFTIHCIDLPFEDMDIQQNCMGEYYVWRSNEQLFWLLDLMREYIICHPLYHIAASLMFLKAYVSEHRVIECLYIWKAKAESVMKTILNDVFVKSMD